MNKKKFIGLGAVAVLCVLTLWVGISHSGVVGGKHDLSLGGTGLFSYDTIDGQINEQVCVFCHTPHGANRNIWESTIYNTSGFSNAGSVSGPMLLWNRNMATIPNFSAYKSGTVNVTLN